MSTTKSKETLTRLAWLTELRRQGHRQCEGPAIFGTRQVCAIVLLHELVHGDTRVNNSPRETAKLATGLTEDQCDQVILMNDGWLDHSPHDKRARRKGRKRTFAEIADVVASWFPND